MGDVVPSLKSVTPVMTRTVGVRAATSVAAPVPPAYGQALVQVDHDEVFQEDHHQPERRRNRGGEKSCQLRRRGGDAASGQTRHPSRIKRGECRFHASSNRVVTPPWTGHIPTIITAPRPRRRRPARGSRADMEPVNGPDLLFGETDQRLHIPDTQSSSRIHGLVLPWSRTYDGVWWPTRLLKERAML